MGGFLTLLLGLIGLATAMGVLVVAFREAHGAIEDEESRRFVATLAVTAGAFLVFSLFCIALLLIRHLAYQLTARPERDAPTPYVNAWELAGKRMKTPPEEPDGDDDFEGQDKE